MNTNKVDWASEVQGAVLAMKEEGQKAYTFIKQEAPEVAREYIVWKRAQCVVKPVSALIFCAIAYAVGKKMWLKQPKVFERYGEKREQDMDGYRTGAVFLFAISAALAFAVAMDAPRLLKPWIAPRITIIEGIKEVVR